MKKMLPLLKNKFFIVFAVFVVYGAFLDEYDVFTIVSQRSKLNKLEKAKVMMSNDLIETKETLAKLKYRSEVEKYAREKKFFKKDDEDIFVISYE